MKNFSKIAIYLLIGVVSFFFFLFISFPYKVLKETVSNELSKQTGFYVVIGDLSPSLPVGLSVEGLELESAAGKHVKFNEINVNLGILNLLVGDLKVFVDVVDNKKGSFDLGVGLGLLDVLGGGTPIPSLIEVTAKNFAFGDLIGFLLGESAKGGEGSNILVRQFLEKIALRGKLNADVSLAVNKSDLGRSKGKIDLQMKNMVLDLDPSMNLASQKFEHAVVKASLANGSFKLDPRSMFKSQGMQIKLSGNVKQKLQLEKSLANLKVEVELFEGLKKDLGFLLDAVAGKQAFGKLMVQVTGPILSNPSVEFQ